ncbi:MAG: DUF433 domain-containing protein [Spirochaetaceae bacterium]|nr:DUF433 domain-containing protein [Spirochaetaceae bacterium]
MLDVSRVAHSDPKILSGTPVFTGTRVPVRILFEFLAAGDKLDEFLDAYPSVSRAQAVSLLEVAEQIVIDGARSA